MCQLIEKVVGPVILHSNHLVFLFEPSGIPSSPEGMKIVARTVNGTFMFVSMTLVNRGKLSATNGAVAEAYSDERPAKPKVVIVSCYLASFVHFTYE